jgi:UDP-glucuronate 4-epimerase
VRLLEEACGRSAQLEMVEMQPGDVAETFADISAIQADLGFQPTTAIDQGVPRFVSWYRDYHRL